MDHFTLFLATHPDPPDEHLQRVRLLLEDYLNEELPPNYTIQDFCAHMSQLDLRHEIRGEIVAELYELLEDDPHRVPQPCHMRRPRRSTGAEART